ncbi:hypothetical protein BBB57_05305 [Kosakonia sacchari]|nr:hypothetical protein C813_05310 [Kosakonia sacchari SP1]ANR77728.1 hypothetical protein BBB57_05305 [Kosakonia sacchari]
MKLIKLILIFIIKRVDIFITGSEEATSVAIDENSAMPDMNQIAKNSVLHGLFAVADYWHRFTRFLNNRA